jgi:thiosulfate reductase/polysulfide reductase chain A
MGLSYTELEEKGVLFTENSHSLYLEEGQDYAFKTNTGLIELYATTMEDEGFDVFPEYTEHPQAPQGYFRLNYGRAPMHTFSRTTNNRYLNDLYPENPLWINPSVAENLNLRTGDQVKLENQQGIRSTTSTKVRVTARIGKDSVYLVHGFGHTDKRLKRTFGKGISDAELMSTVMMDPIMGGTGMRGNFVKIIKVDRKGIFS